MKLWLLYIKLNLSEDTEQQLMEFPLTKEKSKLNEILQEYCFRGIIWEKFLKYKKS